MLNVSHRCNIRIYVNIYSVNRFVKIDKHFCYYNKYVVESRMFFFYIFIIIISLTPMLKKVAVLRSTAV